MDTYYKSYTPITDQGEGITHLKLEIYHENGGMNYFNGQVNKKGIYLSWRGVKLEKRENFTCQSFMMFGGLSGKILLKELNRKSDKKGQAIADILSKNGKLENEIQRAILTKNIPLIIELSQALKI